MYFPGSFFGKETKKVSLPLFSQELWDSCFSVCRQAQIGQGQIIGLSVPCPILVGGNHQLWRRIDTGRRSQVGAVISGGRSGRCLGV